MKPGAIQRLFSKMRSSLEINKADLSEPQSILRQGSQICFDSMPLKVHWQITNECNYRCSYCFLSNSGYKKEYCSLEQAEQAIKHIASANRPGYQVSLLGGEPSMHPYLSEIINLLGKYLGDRLEKITLITNGCIKESVIEAINNLASSVNIELKVSLHFEFVRKENIVFLLEKLSEDVSLKFMVMLHPGLFDRVQRIVDLLLELRNNHGFDISINLIREPPLFLKYDSRYTDEHMIWKKEKEAQFRKIAEESGVDTKLLPPEEGFVFTYDELDGNEVKHTENVSLDLLSELTNCRFTGMNCCAGVSVLEIYTNGTTRGMVCQLAKRKCNIYKENPFERKGWMYAVKCTKPRCNCSIDYRIPRFLSAAEAQDFIEARRKEQMEIGKF